MKPEVVKLTGAAMDSLRERVKANQLNEADRLLLDQIMGSYVHLSALLAEKDITITRLRSLIFGSPSEATENLFPSTTSNTGQDENPANTDPPGSENQSSSKSDDPPPLDPSSTPPASSSSEDPPTADAAHDESPLPTGKKRRKGHGRRKADDYRGASERDVEIEQWKSGDPCPECEDGILYQKPPNVIVRMVGLPPLQGTIYRLKKLRCHLCGYTITARLPEGIGDEKYHASARAMIALLRYGMGLPMNRLRRLQAVQGIPLPVSTQWELLAKLADDCGAAHAALERLAAQGELYFTDDTGVKILSLMNGKAKQQAFEEDDDDQEKRRTGLFTTGIVVKWERHKIVLFTSDRRHAGETIVDLMGKRADDLPAPLHMCDALSCNMPADLKTIIANCLVHARRKFVQVREYFENECRHVIEALSLVYQHDAATRDQRMTDEQRLEYHQVHSGPVMTQLHAWLNDQLTNGNTEPHSSLGKAIKYMLRHWDRLTLFLRHAGAPLDNNTCERALKRAIIHRRNSLFYKTENGARVGDMLMSLIYTAELNGANPLDYLIALQRHAAAVQASPQAWFPWNYQESVTSQSNTSSQPELQAVPP